MGRRRQVMAGLFAVACATLATITNNSLPFEALRTGGRAGRFAGTGVTQWSHLLLTYAMRDRSRLRARQSARAIVHVGGVNAPAKK